MKIQQYKREMIIMNGELLFTYQSPCGRPQNVVEMRLLSFVSRRGSCKRLGESPLHERRKLGGLPSIGAEHGC